MSFIRNTVTSTLHRDSCQQARVMGFCTPWDPGTTDGIAELAEKINVHLCKICFRGVACQCSRCRS